MSTRLLLSLICIFIFTETITAVASSYICYTCHAQMGTSSDCEHHVDRVPATSSLLGNVCAKYAVKFPNNTVMLYRGCYPEYICAMKAREYNNTKHSLQKCSICVENLCNDGTIITGGTSNPVVPSVLILLLTLIVFKV